MKWKLGGKLGQISDGIGKTALDGALSLVRPIDRALTGLDDVISGQDRKEAARDAAQDVEDAQQEALSSQRNIYDESVARQDPFEQGGLGSLASYLELIGDEGAAQFKADYIAGDEFQRNLAQGTDQITANAAFDMSLGTGGVLKDVQKYGQNLAFDQSNQALQNELGRLGLGVGMAQRAAEKKTLAGQNFGQQQAKALGRIGDARATGRLGGASTGIAPWLDVASTAANVYGATQGAAV